MIPSARAMESFPPIPFFIYNSRGCSSPGLASTLAGTLFSETVPCSPHASFPAPIISPVSFSTIALFSIAFLPSTARAQDAEREVAQVVKSLSAPSQEVIRRLYGLRQLPAGEWRFHAGDLEHGEAVIFDDASWPIAKPRTDAPTRAVWYSRLIEVPKTFNGYDLTGSRIWFHFEANANGPMPQIIYFNGRRVALGEDLEPIVLFDSAKPGDKVLVAVKLLHTVDKKQFGGAELRIDFSPTRPNPEDLCLEFVSSTLLIPSLSSDPSQQKATSETAIGAVDLKALDAADQDKFDASLRKAH